MDSVDYIVVDGEHAGQRIDNFLLGRLKGVPKSHVYRLLRSGQVRVNKGRIKQTYRLQAGDVVRVPPVREAAREAPPSPAQGEARREAGGEAHASTPWPRRLVPFEPSARKISLIVGAQAP